MKRIAKLATCLALVFALVLPVASITKAASGSSSVAISNDSPSVGDTITVTFSVSSDTEMMGGDIYINYDSSILELSGGASGSGGSAIIQDAYQGEATKSFSASATFKVIAVGSGRVGVSGDTLVEAAYSADKWNISGSSAAINVGGGAATGSSTNTLSALSVSAVNSAGTATELILSPAFSAGTTTYSTAAPSDTVKLSISATTSDGNATTSVRYANMDPGANKTYIDVTAENGEVLTYVIQTNVDDAAYAEMKAGAEPETTTVSDADASNTKQVQATLTIEGRSITVLTPDDTIVSKAPKGFSKVELQIEGKNIEGWICDVDENYCLMYAENESGEKGFYLYDLKEKTIMRYSEKLMSAVTSDDTKETSSFDKNFKIISYAIIGGLAVVAIIFIILFFKQRNKSYDDEFEDEDEEDEDDEFDDEDEDDEDNDDGEDEDDEDEYIFKKPKKAKEKRRKMDSEDLTPEEMEFIKQVRAEEEKRMAEEKAAEEARKAEADDFFETEIDMDEFENKQMNELDKEIIQSSRAVEQTLENDFDFLDLDDNEGM